MESVIATLTEGQRHMDKKIDILFTKLDHNTAVSETALGLAQKIDGVVVSLKEKTDSHESKLNEHEIRKAKIEGGVKVLIWVSGMAWFCISAFYYLYIRQMKKEIGDDTMARVQNSNIEAKEIAPNTGIFKIRIFESR